MIKPITFSRFLPAVFWFIIINVLISIPGGNLPKLGSWFDLLKADKLIHTGLFAGLVLLLFYPVYQSGLLVEQKRKWLIRIALFSLVWGVATELIQKFYIKNRSFDLKDVTADSIGTVLCWLWFWLKLSKIKS